MRRLDVLALSLMLLLAVTPACGGDDKNQACLDTAAAIYEAVQRCSLPDSYESIEAALKCERVVGVRDEVELREDCFRSLRTASCDDILAGRLPSSCQGQLLVK